MRPVHRDAAPPRLPLYCTGRVRLGCRGLRGRCVGRDRNGLASTIGGSARTAGCGRRPGHCRPSLPVPVAGSRRARCAAGQFARSRSSRSTSWMWTASRNTSGVSLADAVIARLATGGAIRVRPVAATRPYDQGIPRRQSRGADAAGRLRPHGHAAPYRRTRSRAAPAAARRDGAKPSGVARSRSPRPISSASKRRFRERIASAFQAHGHTRAQAARRIRWHFRRTCRDGLTSRS